MTSHVRYLVLAMIFAVSTLNYADRATLSIAGPAASAQLGFDAVTFGYLFSAFGWAYVIGQIPGGGLMDRFGSKNVYAVSLFAWSLFTFLQGFAGWLAPGTAVVLLFAMRFLLGFAEAPSFPGNARIVAAWFPAAERGTASAIFNSTQYTATVIFAPLCGWIAHSYGWPHVFFVTGALGLFATALWMKTIYSPREHPRISPAELEYIAQGGALVDMDRPAARKAPFRWSHLRELLGHRMLLGVYIGQFSITTLTYFFITWFPVYLVQERGMSILKAGFAASLPALCGAFGSVLGGVFSDGLLRRGHSLSFSRKLPIVLGMLLSMSMIVCNYVSASWLVVTIMSLSFLGKGIGSLGWAVVSDTSPREIAGLSGGLFNMFGNTAAITTPLVIGYIVQGTKSFRLALVYVAANAAVAIASYLLIVGEIKRVELRKVKS